MNIFTLLLFPGLILFVMALLLRKNRKLMALTIRQWFWTGLCAAIIRSCASHRLLPAGLARLQARGLIDNAVYMAHGSYYKAIWFAIAWLLHVSINITFWITADWLTAMCALTDPHRRDTACWTWQLTGLSFWPTWSTTTSYKVNDFDVMMCTRLVHLTCVYFSLSDEIIATAYCIALYCIVWTVLSSNTLCDFH